MLHTHTKSGCAVAAQKDGLLPLNQMSMEFYGNVAYHDYEGIALDLGEQKRLVKDLGDKPVMILRNHGLLTVGRDVQQAFLRMYYLEKACEIQVTAQSGGAALSIRPRKSASTPSAKFRRALRVVERHARRSRWQQPRLDGHAAPARPHRSRLQGLSPMHVARRLWLFALILGTLLLGQASADELVGRYQAAGTTPKGKPYSGTVQIEQLGADLHVILWKLADGEAYKVSVSGKGDVLGAAYGPADVKFGIVVYQVKGGTLTGVWADSRDLKSELGKENAGRRSQPHRHVQDHARPEPRRPHQLRRPGPDQAQRRELHRRLADQAAGDRHRRAAEETCWSLPIPATRRRCRASSPIRRWATTGWAASGRSRGSNRTGQGSFGYHRAEQGRPRGSEARALDVMFCGFPAKKPRCCPWPCAASVPSRRRC